GIIMIIAADFALRQIRGQLQAYLGARLDNQVNESAFRQLLHMQLNFTENAPVGSQLTRLKQMGSIRDAFTGMLVNSVFDLPFLLLFLVVIAMIGGSLVYVPIALMVGYAVIAAWAIPTTKRLVRTAGDRKSKLHNLLVEAVSSQATIHELHAEESWLERHRKLSAQAVEANMKARQANVLVQTLSQSFVTMAGVMTLAIGVHQVIEGTLSAGALIAVMALSWRVLGPIRNIFLSGLTLGQTLQSIDQVDRLLRMNVERQPNAAPSIVRDFKGHIVFDRLSFRYPTQREPALRGVSFTAAPGQLVCITGQSGAGKTTTLKMLLGLYDQQAGSIFVDGLDVRQIEAGEWRQSVSVTPEDSDFFFGTLAQNIRLAAPDASDEDIHNMAKRFGLNRYYSTVLDQGLDTKVTAAALATWPDALKKRLSLCRTFIRHSSVYLLDNPSDNLDDDGEQALLEIIAERRQKSTILMVTHRPSHMRLAEQVVWLDQGAVRAAGSPDDIIPALLAA
ncbi:MAG: ABC transporter transmembrane domain-containing protein, partial [Pseudomonadota bacterium]